MAKTLSTMLELGSNAIDFSLPDINLVTRDNTSLASFAANEAKHKGLLVAFICNHCPFVVLIADALAKVLNEAQRQGIQVVAINSNDVANYPADSPEKMTEFAKQYSFEFPYLFDEDQSIAKAYTAACTPDFFLYDDSSKLVYRGQFDSARPGNNIAATGDDLTKAINQLLNGEIIDPEQVASLGCNIKWKVDNAPDYF